MIIRYTSDGECYGGSKTEQGASGKCMCVLVQGDVVLFYIPGAQEKPSDKSDGHI